MGFCTRRSFFLSVCILQMLTVVQRQVFDFLGFLWIPILANFFEIIFIIFGFFGAYQYRPNYIIAYILWHVFWLGWNIFIICLYLNVVGLDHENNKVLKLDRKSESWWKKGGPGCKIKDVDAVPVEYESCLINYIEVEIIQASIQCFFTVICSIIGICLSRVFLEEDDTFNFEKPDGPQNILLQPMYVSDGDNLNSSNKFLNLPYNKFVVTNKTRNKSNNRCFHADTIRNPNVRSNSLNAIVTTYKNGSKRPQSLYSEAYFDMD